MNQLVYYNCMFYFVFRMIKPFINCIFILYYSGRFSAACLYHLVFHASRLTSQDIVINENLEENIGIQCCIDAEVDGDRKCSSG